LFSHLSYFHSTPASLAQRPHALRETCPLIENSIQFLVATFWIVCLLWTIVKSTFWKSEHFITSNSYPASLQYNTTEHPRYLDMAYVLSLMPQSPLGTPYDQRSYERSWSSLGSTGTVHHRRSRQLSVGSLASAASLCGPSWRSPSNNGTPLRSTSYSDFGNGTYPAALHRPTTSTNISRPVSVPPAVPQLVPLATPLPSPTESEPLPGTLAFKNEYSGLDLVDEERGDWEEDHALLGSDIYDSSAPNIELPVADQDAVTSSRSVQEPFSRWMNTLRLKKASYKTRIRPKLDTLFLQTSDQSVVNSPEPSVRGHRKSGSWASSANFVTAVKSATITVASASIAPLSRSASKRSGHRRLYRGSSGLFESEPRFSTDSGCPSLSLIIDDAARQRTRKRREKIEELIKTEESYLSDLKALSNVSLLCGDAIFHLY
jgi:hypothetical protein